jgi:hypothetical protein
VQPGVLGIRRLGHDIAQSHCLKHVTREFGDLLVISGFSKASRELSTTRGEHEQVLDPGHLTILTASCNE